MVMNIGSKLFLFSTVIIISNNLLISFLRLHIYLI